MVQKDYVSHQRYTGKPRKKSGSRGKKRSSSVSVFMAGLTAALLITFLGILWFLSHAQKENMPNLPIHPSIGNGLPAKPEERWRYIKELENRQLNLPAPKEPSTGSDLHSHTPLTYEQRQLLEQIQVDMRQQPTQLNEVPWNDQTPVRHQHQPTQQIQQQSHPAPTRPTTVPTSKLQGSIKNQNKPVKKWMVQCGSFKGSGQAESVRAMLAFEGFESRITTGGGWNRVVVGPYDNRSSVDRALKQLRNSGHSNCIPLATGG